MRLGKALKITAIVVPVVVVALVVGAIAVLMNTDFNRYKPRIAEEVKAATGRDLAIAGDLTLKVSLTPAVTVEGVTLSNAAWGSRPEMVKVGRFEAEIALIPVLFGTIEVNRLILVGADILLEVDKQGRVNFEFEPAGGKPAAKPAAKPEPKPESGEGGALPLPVVHEVVIRDSRMTYADAQAGATYRAAIDTLTLRGEGPDAPLDLDFAGSYNDTPVTLAGTLGAPAEMLKPSKPWPVDATLKAGGATVTVKGTIAEPVKAKGLALAVSVEGGQLGDLSALAGAEVPKLGAYSLSTRVTGDPASSVSLAGLKGALAGSDIAGDVKIALGGKRPAVAATLSSQKIDLDALGGGGAGEATGGSAGGGGQAAPKSDRVFPDDPLPLDAMRAVDAKVDLAAKLIVAGGARLENAKAGLSLVAGNLAIAPLEAALADGTVDGSVKLDGRRSAAALVVKAAIEKVDLDRLLTEMKITEDVEGRANIDIDVAGNGSSVRRIMASLDGRAGLLMGQGRMKDTFMQNMLGGSGNLLNQILDKGKTGYTLISCAVADFGVKDGVATAKALYLDTETMGIVGSGTVNLGNETLNLLVDPRRKKNMGAPLLPVRIKGTFLAPDYDIDRKAAVGTLGRRFGLDLPPLLQGGRSGTTGAPLVEGPCAPPAPPEQPAAQQPAPEAPAAPTTPKEAIEEQLEKGLKGLFGK